jgi:CRP/FNR family cyclic AMP-dependent transcriptional regulator
MDSLTDILASNALFANFSDRDLADIAVNANHKAYRDQEILVLQEEVWPYLFLIADGKIDAIKESAEGRSFIATSLKAGDVFWGLAFFIEYAPMPVLLQAKEATQIYLWSREYMVPIIQKHGDMSWRLCQVMISRMQLASAIVEDLAFQPVMGRLAGLILSEFSDAEDEFKSRELTLEEMASRIGTTREMVCRHLYRFAEKGAIQIKRTELRITDRSMLEKQAGR